MALQVLNERADKESDLTLGGNRQGGEFRHSEVLVERPRFHE